MITICINETSLKVEPNFSVLQVLQQIDSPLQGIAVAINSQIIPQTNWQTTELKSGDEVLVIQATQGG